MKTILSIFSLLIAFTTMYSQNYLYQSDESGLHGSAFLSTSNFEDKAVLMPGYTVKGRLTIGVDIGKGRDKINKISSTIVRPNIHYLAMKQNDDLPISLDLEGAYQINILPTTTFNSKALQIGANLYHELQLESEFKFIPFIGTLANRTSIKSGTIESEDTYLIYSLGITLVYNNLTVTPKYVRNNSLNAVGIGVGILL